jgi:hypothetical protein
VILRPKWNYEVVPKDGAAGASAYVNTLAGTTPPPDRLPREGIQNSRDARRHFDGQVQIKYRLYEVYDNEKLSFLEALQIDENSLHPDLAAFAASHTISKEAIQQPLKLLYCEDFQTMGLKGDPTSYDETPWRTYLHSLGESGKEEGGGAYGFGKSVFPALSRIKTIVIYSVSDQEGPRLTALTIQKRFHVDDLPYGPRGWLSTHKDGWQIPVSGDDAIALAADLKFERRPDETGLSVLIIDHDIDAPSLRAGVETHWWPALEEKKISVEILDVDGNLTYPKPRKRADLLPYINSYRLATGANISGSKAELSHKFTKQDMGTLGAVTAEECQPSETTSNGVPSNRVALIRDLLMVVDYMPVLPRNPISFHAVFVSSPSACEFFRMAEPPAHDRWIDDPRLDQTSDPVRAHHIVKSFGADIAIRLGLWLKQFKPTPPPTDDRLRELDDIVGRLLKVKKSGPIRPPDHPPVPLRFRTDFSEPVVAGLKSIHFEAKLWVENEYTGEPLRVVSSPTCRALIDTRLTRDSEEIGLAKFDWHPREACSEEGPGVWSFTIGSGEAVTITAESNSFDPRYFVELALNLEVTQ